MSYIASIIKKNLSPLYFWWNVIIDLKREHGSLPVLSERTTGPSVSPPSKCLCRVGHLRVRLVSSAFSAAKRYSPSIIENALSTFAQPLIKNRLWNFLISLSFSTSEERRGGSFSKKIDGCPLLFFRFVTLDCSDCPMARRSTETY